MAKVLLFGGIDLSDYKVKTVGVPQEGKKTISLSVTPSGSGSVTGGGNYDEGQQVTIKATASSGYKFVQWNDGVTTAERTIVVGSKSASYVAQFAALPSVPQISLDTTAKTASLSEKNGYAIKYSTDGSTPTTSSTTYASAIDVSNGATIKAIAVNGSDVSSVPAITTTYDENDGTISFASSASGTIRYTTDGSTPNSSSTAYSSALTPTTGETIKVAVFNGTTLNSEIATIQIQ